MKSFVEKINQYKIVIISLIAIITGTATFAGDVKNLVDSEYVTYAALEKHDLKSEIRKIKRENKKLKLKIDLKQASDLDKALFEQNKIEIDSLNDELKDMKK